MAKTFYGGVTLGQSMQKVLPQKLKTERIALPELLRIPLSEDGKKPALPFVSRGERVTKGQPIAGSCEAMSRAENDSDTDVRLFAPASGTVEAFGVVSTEGGSVSKCIILRTDGEETVYPGLAPETRRLTDLSPRDILRRIKSAGIPMNDRSGFPSYDTLFPEGKEPLIKELVIDCTENEPYVYSNHAAVICQPAYVAGGAKIIMKMLGLRRATFAATSEMKDYYDIYEQLRNLPESKSPLIASIKPSEKNLFNIVRLKAKYPSQSESLILNSIFEKEFPQDKPITERGIMIVSAGVCRAVFSAFVTGMPYTERIVTVNGDCVREPSNLIVPFGTSADDAVAYCRGLKRKPEKLVFSGMLSGSASVDPNTPITAKTSSILLFSRLVIGKTRIPVSLRYEAPPTCIGCGKCISVCPMHLMPLHIAEFSHLKNYRRCKTYSVDLCTECGCCEYICPGRVPLLKYIRSAKCFSADLEPEKETVMTVITDTVAGISPVKKKKKKKAQPPRTGEIRKEGADKNGKR